MKELRSIIIIIIISAAAGGIVSIPVSIIEKNTHTLGILQGAAIGAIIGLAARFAFASVYLHLRKHPLPAYLAMAGTVGAGTLAGCLVTGVQMLPAGLAAVGISVAVGLILTRLISSYYEKLNQQLRQKKKSFSPSDESASDT